MTLPLWCSDYVGIPYEHYGRSKTGVDCWGLAKLVLMEQFSLDVPNYDVYYHADCDVKQIGADVTDVAGNWQSIPAGDEQPGDVALLRCLGQPIHVGVVVASEWMIHAELNIDSCLEKYTGPRWNRRVTGFYRFTG
jgi:probable lipoprotein NlpC